PVLHGLTVGLSSGTSGHRGLFLLSPAEQAAWAGTILARALHGMPTRRLRVAFFLRSNSNLYEQTNGKLVRFRYFDLMTPLREVHKALEHFQPTIVVGPPSLLHMLAQAKQDGTLHIAPARLISVAEVLEPQVQNHIELAFAAPVHQIYQCTEGLLAVSCRAGSLHVQEDIVRLQWEPLRDDEQTDVHRYAPIVTDLWRTTQPIIRYRLDDVVQLDPRPCACGSDWQVIGAIEGRCDDVCWFEREEGGQRPFFPDTLRRMLLLSSAAILDYEIIQGHDGALTVHLSLPPAVDSATLFKTVRTSIDTTIRGYGCRTPELKIDAALVLPPPGTKRRRVQHRSTLP
ncbi:MAG: Adenylate-forming enzyme, partial [uncultured Chloroflexia bacterium]